MKIKLINKVGFYCPLCQAYYEKSAYLGDRFKGQPRTEWLANMVCHYRHYHAPSYESQLNYLESRGWLDETKYEEIKRAYNERAKRQIARKCPGFLRKHGIGVFQFANLRHTEMNTLQVVYTKLLKNKKKYSKQRKINE